MGKVPDSEGAVWGLWEQQLSMEETVVEVKIERYGVAYNWHSCFCGDIQYLALLPWGWWQWILPSGNRYVRQQSSKKNGYGRNNEHKAIGLKHDWASVFYGITDSDDVAVHIKKHFLLVPQIPDLEGYMKLMLDSFFRTARTLDLEIEKYRMQEYERWMYNTEN